MKTPPPNFRNQYDIDNPDKLVRVPVGPGSERWRTVQFSRTVLMIVRTATTLVRLMQIAEHLLSDTRIQIVFTICDGRSAYARNLELAIIEHGCVYIPWTQARGMAFDLAISASLNGPLAEVDAPLLLIDHGPGHTKNVSIPSDDNSEWQALAKATSQRRVLVFTNDGEDAFFPDTFEKVVIGDPMLDAILAAKRKRNVYREQLDIGDRKLIVLSSTWGSNASFAKAPELASSLLQQLPSSEYALASILHPNIWIGHGDWQVRVWYRDAIDAGMLLVPFYDAWQAVVASADIMLGDHGSVTLYANMAGIPLARLSYDSADMKSDMGVVAAAEETPLLRTLPEVIGFIEQDHPIDEARIKATRQSSFANVGHATRAFWNLIYKMLNLEPNEKLREPYEFAIGFQPKHPFSYYVQTTEAPGTETTPRSIQLYPAAVGRCGATREAMLLARIEESNYRILQSCYCVICSDSYRDCWQEICPSAKYAFMTRDGKAALVTRLGEKLAVTSNLENPFASCAAALTLAGEAAYGGVFSCGQDEGSVSVERPSPTDRIL